MQGYKFNIFYPDLLYVSSLITPASYCCLSRDLVFRSEFRTASQADTDGSDKTKAPEYHVKDIPGDLDTQIIVFTAGPPYEDIAFRIVRRPWEYSHKKGFKCVFDRGVLQCEFSAVLGVMNRADCSVLQLWAQLLQEGVNAWIEHAYATVLHLYCHHSL